MSGNSKKGKKALYKASRSTATITGGTVGFMVGGPAGAVGGAIYSGVAADILATAITGQEHGYIKESGDFIKDVKDDRVPVKPAIRLGLRLGFDIVTGKGINDVPRSDSLSLSDMGSNVRHQITKKSLGMNKEGFRKKVNKHVIKHTAEYALKDRSGESLDSESDDDSGTWNFKRPEYALKDRSTNRSRKSFYSDSESDDDSDTWNFKRPDSEYITYRRYPYFQSPYSNPYTLGFNGNLIDDNRSYYGRHSEMCDGIHYY